MMRRLLRFIAPFICACTVQAVHAGAFIFAGESNGVNIVAHPRVYTGTGGTLANLTVCIDPGTTQLSAQLAAQAELSVRNAVNTYNRLRSIPDNNLAFSSNNDIASSKVDFESTLLHEMGHCQGLAHPNHATESGFNDPERNGTKSTDGSNNTFNQNAGTDGNHGSSDDVRGDDINLHWYIRNVNNPGLLPSIFDSSTMIRDLTDLPSGHLFAANADRDVMDALGFVNTEAVMQQGAFYDEAQRHLQRDDETTLRLARSGVDRTQGNADDYTYQLEYVGLYDNPNSDADCNLRIQFNNTSGFAVCSTNGSFIDSNNIRITTADLGFELSNDWHFSSGANTVTTIVSDSFDPSGSSEAYSVHVTVREAAGITISGEPKGTVEVTDDLGTTCTIDLIGTPNEEGSCDLTTSTVGDHTITAQFLGYAGWDASSGTATHSVSNTPIPTTTTITSDSPDPSVVGESYTVAVMVSSSSRTPTGTVVIDDGNVSCTTPALVSGNASCDLTSTSTGAKTLTAVYTASGILSGSSGTTIHQVNKADSATAITVTPSPSVQGFPFTVRYSVNAQTPGTGTPSGGITVTVNNSNETCSGTLSAGVGSCTITLPDLGSYTLTATYSGDSSFNSSIGTITHEVVPDDIFEDGFE